VGGGEGWGILYAIRGGGGVGAGAGILIRVGRGVCSWSARVGGRWWKGGWGKGGRLGVGKEWWTTEEEAERRKGGLRMDLEKVRYVCAAENKRGGGDIKDYSKKSRWLSSWKGVRRERYRIGMQE